MKPNLIRCVYISLLFAATAGAYPLHSAINTKSYESDSGEYKFVVDPKDRSGWGAAEYRFVHKGETTWTKELPYTLVDAKVSQSGIILGHANLMKRDDEGNRVAETFMVVLIDRDGNVRFQEEREKVILIVHGPGLPYVQSLHMDDSKNRAIANIAASDQTPQQWMVFDLSTAKLIGTITPKTPEETANRSLRLSEAELIPGTSLMLSSWFELLVETEGFRANTYFALHDLDGKMVWSLLDSELDKPGESDGEDSDNAWEFDRTKLLAVTESATFDIWLEDKKQRATYAVEHTANATPSVREVNRVPYTPKRKQVRTFEMPAFPEITVEKPVTVSLGGRVKRERKPEQGRIFDFEPTEDGSICSLRVFRDDRAALLLHAPNGDLLGEIDIPKRSLPTDVDYVGPTCTGGRRFVAAVCGYEKDDRSTIYLADFDTQTITALPDTDCPKITAVAGFRDGRFVALTERDAGSTVFDGLYFFNADGSVAWNREQGGTDGSPNELFSPEDITRIDENTFAILENISGKIKVFDTNDTLVNVFDLEKIWGREPSYPTDISLDPAGGFVIYDFDAPKPIVRVTSEGVITAEGLARYDDGRPFSTQGGIKISTDGSMWTSDGTALMRISEDGMVQSTLGPKPKLDDLDEPYYSIVGPNDKIYIGDSRTNALHVYDPSGAHIGVCKPDPDDLTETSEIEDVGVTPTGEIYVHFGDDMNDLGKGAAYVHFGANFARIAQVRLKPENSANGLRFQPSGKTSWLCGYDELLLSEGVNGNSQTIGKNAKNQWLESLAGFSVAPDGSAAVFSGQMENGFYINTFTSDGKPIASFEVSKDWQYADLAYDGGRIYALVDGDVFIMEQDGKPVGKFRVARGNDSDYIRGPFYSSSNREIQFIDLRGPNLLKFDIPSN